MSTEKKVVTNTKTEPKTTAAIETPEQTFTRLCEYRVNKTLKAISQIRQLATRKPSQEQRKKVFDTLGTALINADKAWTGTKDITQGFKL